MDSNDILKMLNDIFADILDTEHLVLTSETTAGDVEEWDSLNHIQLVVAIERKLGIRFTAREIQSWSRVGELVLSIQGKLKKEK
jgi:acyl carrier protein